MLPLELFETILVLVMVSTDDTLRFGRKSLDQDSNVVDRSDSYRRDRDSRYGGGGGAMIYSRSGVAIRVCRVFVGGCSWAVSCRRNPRSLMTSRPQQAARSRAQSQHHFE